MSSKGSQPAAPDPRETASTEAQFNRLNTYGPTGSGVRYGYTNNQGNFVEGPAPGNQQAAVRYLPSTYERNMIRLLQPASMDLTRRVINDNIDNMPDAPRIQDRSDIAETIFNRNFSLMAPAIDRSNEALITNLQGRGIPVGSEAFNDAYGDQQTRTQDTLARMAMDADIAAGQEQSRVFGLDSAQRDSAVRELVAAMGGGYSTGAPQPSGNAPGVNYSGLVGQQYQAQVQQAQAANQNRMATANTLGSIGSALIKSSVTAKAVQGIANVSDAAAAIMEIPVHLWSYLPHERPQHDHGGMHIGPMAQDFQAATGLGRPTHIDLTDYLGTLMAALQSALVRIEVLEKALSFEQAAKPARMH